MHLVMILSVKLLENNEVNNYLACFCKPAQCHGVLLLVGGKYIHVDRISIEQSIEHSYIADKFHLILYAVGQYGL